MKASRLKQVWALVLILSLSAAAVGAATITKTNNVDALNLASSWVGATVPGESDVAQWNSTVTGDNAVSLGADLSWAGIRIANPGGAVTVGAGNTLTLGASGIDMGSATTNLTISAGLTLLANARQLWNVASGRTLTVDTGTFARGPGAVWLVQGLGKVAAPTVANDATGLVGPWACLGSGTSTRYIAMSGGLVSNFSGVPVGTAGGVADTTGTTNYEVAAVGAVVPGAAFHTLRYTGPAGTITNAFQADGLLHCGSGTLAFSGPLTIGTNRELVVLLPSSALTLSAPVSNSTEGASSVTKSGSGQLNLDGACQFTGPLAIGEGIVKLGATFAGGNYPGAVFLGSGATLQVNTGSAQTLAGNISGPGMIDRWNGGVLTLAGSNSFLGAVQINAGSVKLAHAAALGSASGATLLKRFDDSNRGRLELNGFSTSEPLSFEDGGNAGTTKGFGGYVDNNSSTNAMLTGSITLNKNGTFSGGGTTSVKGLISGAGNLVKEGSGNLNIDTNTAFSGNVVISGGNLQVTQYGRLSGGSYTGSIALAGALTWNSSLTQTLAGVISGGGTLFKWRSDGLLILSGTNSFTGLAQLNAGFVKLATSNALGSAAGATEIRRHDDGNRSALDLNGQTVAEPLKFEDSGYAGSTLGCGGFLENNEPLTNAAVTGTVTLNKHGTVRGVGSIALTGLISGAGRLIKQGTNTLTISGANTYTGATVVAAGTLRLGASGALPAASDVILSGGTLDAGSGSNSGTSLTVSGDSALALGSGAQLEFGDSLAQAWSGSLTLTGALGPHSLRFPDGLTAAQMLSMSYKGGRVYLTWNGYVVTDPPGTMVLLQ